MSSPAAIDRRTVPPRWASWPLWRVALAAGLVASIANVVVYVIARAVGVPLEITEVFADEFGPIPVQSFVLATLLEGALVAALVAAACRRWAPRPRSWFVALGVIGTVASFAAPIVTDGTTATKVVLSIAHVVPAVIIVPALARLLPARRCHSTIATRSTGC